PRGRGRRQRRRGAGRSVGAHGRPEPRRRGTVLLVVAGARAVRTRARGLVNAPHAGALARHAGAPELRAATTCRSTSPPPAAKRAGFVPRKESTVHPHMQRFGVRVSGVRDAAPAGPQDEFSARMGRLVGGKLKAIGGGAVDTLPAPPDHDEIVRTL